MIVFCFSIDEGLSRDYTGVMETAVSIPDEVVQQADELAAALGLSRSELYALAIAEFISQRRDEHITERLNRVYAETDSSLDDATEQLQKISLLTTQEYLERRARRGGREKFERAMNKAADIEPEGYDRL